MPDQSPAHAALRGRFAKVFRCLEMKTGTSWDLKWMQMRLFLSTSVRIHLGFVTASGTSDISVTFQPYPWLCARVCESSWSSEHMAWGQSGKTWATISRKVIQIYPLYRRWPERPLPCKIEILVDAHCTHRSSATQGTSLTESQNGSGRKGP